MPPVLDAAGFAPEDDEPEEPEEPDEDDESDEEDEPDESEEDFDAGSCSRRRRGCRCGRSRSP